MGYGFTGWARLGLFWISDLVWVRVGIRSFSMLVSLEFLFLGWLSGFEILPFFQRGGFQPRLVVMGWSERMAGEGVDRYLTLD